MLWWFLQNTIYLGAGVLALTLMCKGRWFSPATRHALWLLVLIKMLTPSLVVWPWTISLPTDSTFVTSSTGGAAHARPRSAAKVELVDSFVDLTHVAPSRNRRQDASGSRSSSPQVAAPLRRILQSILSGNPQQWLMLAACVWITGGIIALLIITARTIRLLQWISSGEKAPAWLTDHVLRLAGLLSLRPPRVVVSTRVSSPLIWGIGRPTMIWPAHLASRPSSSASSSWEGIVVHELAHLKRGDHWVGVLEIIATLLWWWNPLLWYVRHQVHENAELACDCWVVATLPHGRRAYAEAILDICQSLMKTVVPVPACGVRHGPRRSLERRLAMILRERVHFRIPRSGLLALTLLALITLPTWSQTQDTFGGGQPPPGAGGATPPLLQPGTAGGGDTGLGSTTEGPAIGIYGGSAPGGGGSPAQSPEQLQILEQQLVQLLEQVRSLQATAGGGGIRGPDAGAMGTGFGSMEMPGMSGMMSGAGGGMGSAMSPSGIEVVESVEVRVYRTTYRLPEDKAQAVQQFVKQHFVSEVETRVDGNTLVVLTHDVEDEETMRRFIYLMVGAELPPRGTAPTGVNSSAPPYDVPHLESAPTLHPN
jgi:beta-lactamase regulating signal transducer with metallopeptidase domain